MVGICKKKVIYKKKSLMFRFFSNFSHNGRLRILVRISTSDAAPDKSCTKFVLQIITEEKLQLMPRLIQQKVVETLEKMFLWIIIYQKCRYFSHLSQPDTRKFLHFMDFSFVSLFISLDFNLTLNKIHSEVLFL